MSFSKLTGSSVEILITIEFIYWSIGRLAHGLASYIPYDKIENGLGNNFFIILNFMVHICNSIYI
jgi:hypothetical protein